MIGCNPTSQANDVLWKFSVQQLQLLPSPAAILYVLREVYLWRRWRKGKVCTSQTMEALYGRTTLEVHPRVARRRIYFEPALRLSLYTTQQVQQKQCDLLDDRRMANPHLSPVL